jgi:hypothetical protein
MDVSVFLAAWVLVGTLSMTACQGDRCTPMPGASTVTQTVRRFPTQDVCENTRKQMVATGGTPTTTITQREPKTGTAGIVRQALVWSCQRAPGAQGE